MYAPLAHGERIGRFLAAEGVRAVNAPSGNRPSGGISGGTPIVDGDRFPSVLLQTSCRRTRL
jgi:hypothetical protein